MLSWLENYQLCIAKKRSYYLRFGNSWNFVIMVSPEQSHSALQLKCYLCSCTEDWVLALFISNFFYLAIAFWDMIFLTYSSIRDCGLHPRSLLGVTAIIVSPECHLFILDFISVLQLIPFCSLLSILQTIPDLCWELAQLQDTYILQGMYVSWLLIFLLIIYFTYLDPHFVVLLVLKRQVSCSV